MWEVKLKFFCISLDQYEYKTNQVHQSVPNEVSHQLTTNTCIRIKPSSWKKLWGYLNWNWFIKSKRSYYCLKAFYKRRGQETVRQIQIYMRLSHHYRQNLIFCCILEKLWSDFRRFWCTFTTVYISQDLKQNHHLLQTEEPESFLS